MHVNILSAFFLAAYCIAQGNSQRVCNDKQVIESTPLTMPSGHMVTMQRFNCSNPVPAGQQNNVARSLDLNMKRAASQCTIANCICGVPCFFNHCFPVTMPINAEDCPALSASLASNPSTFIIPPNEGVAFILESCMYSAFGNSATQETEYCFADMGNAASEVFHVCGNTQQGACEGTFGGGNFFVDQLNP